MSRRRPLLWSGTNTIRITVRVGRRADDDRTAYRLREPDNVVVAHFVGFLKPLPKPREQTG